MWFALTVLRMRPEHEVSLGGSQYNDKIRLGDVLGLYLMRISSSLGSVARNDIPSSHCKDSLDHPVL
jgi:hypothetical protein